MIALTNAQEAIAHRYAAEFGEVEVGTGLFSGMGETLIVKLENGAVHMHGADGEPFGKTLPGFDLPTLHAEGVVT